MTNLRKKIAFLTHRDDIETLPPLEKAAFDWLSTNAGYSVDILNFANADRLKNYDAAWYYYSESENLPLAALEAAPKIGDYVESGGRLLLSLIGAKYVEPLGVDNAPDAVIHRKEQFFYNNGYVARIKHPIFENLPKQFHVAPGGIVKPFAAARWLETTPAKGRVLAIATWGARFVEGEKVVVEWDYGCGQIIAVGMHNFRFDADDLDRNLATFANNIFNYLSSPFTAELTLESDKPAVKTGAGYLGEHYGNGGVVIETGGNIRAAVHGKAWKTLNVTITARTPSRVTIVHAAFHKGEKFNVIVPLDVQGLQPGEYVAGIEISIGEDILKSLSKKFFIVPEVPKSGVLADRHWLWELRTKHISLEIDKSTGTIWGIHDPKSENPVQFAGNPDNLNAIATPDHRWLGDIILKYRFEGDTSWTSMTTAQSAPIRRCSAPNNRTVAVKYDPGAPEQIGPANPAITETFSALEDSVEWRINIRNRSNLTLMLGELGLPITLNTFFAGEVDLREIYERKVQLHSFIGGGSSWILAVPLGGRPPYLLIWCKEGSKLEAIAHIDEYGHRPDGWEGLINVFPYSLASRETRCWKEWFNGHTQYPIPPNDELSLRFGIKLIHSYDEIGNVLLNDGKIDISVIPGMVIPTDMTAYVKARCKKKVTVTADKTVDIKPAGEGIYKIRFNEAGQRNVTITDEQGESTNLHFMAVEPIEKLSNAHASHVASNQQVRGHGWRDGMFLMWDAETSSVVMNPRYEFMAGGSDEIGFADVLPLVWKNVVDPNPDEIAAVEYYVEHFLFGRLQKTDTYEVASSLSDDPKAEIDYTRSFNYPHVVNIYFALSKIAERYGLTRYKTSTEYLMMAYHTALAYYELPMYKNNARTIGNFGECFFVELVEKLRKIGCEDEANRIESHTRTKADYFLAKDYPYESEFPFDTTGYAEAYFLKKYAGGASGASPALSMIRATRGRQFSWWWYGGDVRWGWGCSKYPYPDELCLNYMTSQNARPLLDSFNYSGCIDDLRIGYGGYLAYWALIRPDGVAHNLYSWEPQRMLFDPWSSEMGTGMYFLYDMGCSYAVDDPDFGIVGYGCDVDGDAKHHIGIIPHDGIAKRVRICPLDICIETEVGRIERVDIHYAGKKIVLTLRENAGLDLTARITVKGLPKGKYEISADFKKIAEANADECSDGLIIPLPKNSVVPVHIEAVKPKR
jgi:hypothetical protein